MKLREKIIHWLGGYTYQDHHKMEIIRTEKPIITLRSAICFGENPDQREIDYSKQELSYQLAKEMADRHLIVFTLDRPDKMIATVRLVDMN